MTMSSPSSKTPRALSISKAAETRSQDLILPPETLEAVELHVIGIRRQADRLRASGQHLTRGLLLYGPPGTGKTHTVRYLLSCLEGITTVILTGEVMEVTTRAETASTNGSGPASHPGQPAAQPTKDAPSAHA